jgi:hypothetical protein
VADPPFPPPLSFVFFLSGGGGWGEFFLGSLETNKNKDPQFIMGVPISPGQKLMMNSFGNRNFMQPMGRLTMHSKCLDFFSFKFWVGRFYFGEPSKFQLFLVMGQSNWLIFKKKLDL